MGWRWAKFAGQALKCSACSFKWVRGMEVPAQILVNTFVFVLVGAMIAHSIGTIVVNRDVATYATVNYTAYQIMNAMMRAARKAHSLGERIRGEAEASTLVFVGQPYTFRVEGGALEIGGFEVEIGGRRLTAIRYKLPSQLMGLKINYRETSGYCYHVMAHATYYPEERRIEIMVVSGAIQKG